jgi:uncharacterized lipoprotein YbaY
MLWLWCDLRIFREPMLPYDPQDIDERNTYNLAARILDGESKLLFVSDTVVPVITRGNPTSDVEVIVVPVGE